MPQATFWFATPFRDWIGRRTVDLSWEGSVTLRQILDRLAAEHPEFHANVMAGGLQQETFNHMAAVIVDGDFLTLDSRIPDGAKIDVLTPLSGGVRTLRQVLRSPSRSRAMRMDTMREEQANYAAGRLSPRSRRSTCGRICWRARRRSSSTSIPIQGRSPTSTTPIGTSAARSRTAS